MFRVLADEGINIEMISTSTIRISVVIAADRMERALRSLHTAFGLDSAQAVRRVHCPSAADGGDPAGKPGPTPVGHR